MENAALQSSVVLLFALNIYDKSSVRLDPRNARIRGTLHFPDS